MPPLKNPRHESIAFQVAHGKSFSEAMKFARYSLNSVRTQSKRMSLNVGMAERIEEIRDEIRQAASWDAAKVLQRLAEIVDADVSEIYTNNFDLKPMNKWPAYWRKLVCRIEKEPRFERSKDGKDSGWDLIGAMVKIHTQDRLKALELIGKHKAVDAFVQQNAKVDVTINVSDEVRQLIEEGRQRARMRLLPSA